MKTKIMFLLIALAALLGVAFYSNQQKRAEFDDLPHIAQEVDAVTAEAEALNIQVSEMIASIETPDFYWQWVEVNGGQWEPTELDIIFMQRRIQKHVERAATLQNVEARDLDGFGFQYQGVIRDGKRYIYVNGTCRAADSDYLEYEFGIMTDGGTCHFATTFDPETKRYLDSVFFNGEA